MSNKILIIAGEPSGDLHAAGLVHELRMKRPALDCYGMGGDLLRKEGVRIIRDNHDLALVGLSEVLKNLAVVGRAFADILNAVDRERPDLAILVDYPGFNIRLAKALKKRKIPVIYYISPQVWAWGAKRIRALRATVNEILVFFPFEEKLYRDHGIPVRWVGHPLAESVQPTLTREDALNRFGLDGSKKIVAILPGSRRHEVDRLLPVLLESTKKIASEIPGTQFVVARFPGLDEALFQKHCAAMPNVRVIAGQASTILAIADLALITSGTATLEAALLKTPSVIVYKAGFLTFLAYHLVKRIPYIGLANIIVRAPVVPEFLQFDAVPERIAPAALAILNSPATIRRMKETFERIRTSLYRPHSYAIAADAVLSHLPR